MTGLRGMIHLWEVLVVRGREGFGGELEEAMVDGSKLTPSAALFVLVVSMLV